MEEALSPNKKTKPTVRSGVPEMSKLSKKARQKIIVFVVGIIFLAVCTVAVYSSYMLHRMKDPTYQQKLADKQNARIMAEVGALIELPPDAPQIAIVSGDTTTLKKNQPFFEKAIEGDYVLVFIESAILYRPSVHKIINVGQVNRVADKPLSKSVNPVTLDTETPTEESQN